MLYDIPTEVRILCVYLHAILCFTTFKCILCTGRSADSTNKSVPDWSKGIPSSTVSTHVSCQT